METQVQGRGPKDEDADIENNVKEINLDYERDIFKKLNQHIEPMKNPMTEAPPTPVTFAATTTLPPTSPQSQQQPPPPPSFRPPSTSPPPALPRKEPSQPQRQECAHCDPSCIECSPSSECACIPCNAKNKINWKILTLRVCIAFILCSLASGLGAAAFLLLRNIELNTFQQQFASATNQIQTTVTTALKAKFVANSLVENIFRYGIPTGASPSNPSDTPYLIRPLLTYTLC